jgi:NAD(P)-dependent dehydrogenase (short-subunit alcohol dehydrogenase family)
MPHSVIIGIGSDIGRELATRFLADGWTVWGTVRTDATVAALAAGVVAVPCDLTARAAIAACVEAYRQTGLSWDVLVIAAGTEEPIGRFLDCDPDDWERGLEVNALAPLRLLRGLHRFRNRTAAPAVAFFSGAGTNNAAPAYSAYCVSKILLMKMCELLDAESDDTSYFIVGPGIVRTKIHEQTLAAPERSGANYDKVVNFLASADPGTSHDDIYACLRWCAAAGKAVIGGRNIALAHDGWRDGGAALLAALAADPNLYKLRRSGNDWRDTGQSP